MQIRLRELALAALFLVVLVALPRLSLADQVQDLNVHLSMYCPHDAGACAVSPYIGAPGTPADGLVNFGSMQRPWSFNFMTANPNHWQCDPHCEDYYATFGVGGTFLMDGPDGLTFTGEITSGKSWQNVDSSWGADMSFVGQWSNGLSAYGSFTDTYNGQIGPYASLDVYTAPEHSSLALLGGGMLGLWGIRRRI